MRALSSLTFLFLCCCTAQSTAPQSLLVESDAYVIQGAATKDHLWVLTSDNIVLEYDRPSGDRRIIAEDGVYDIQHSNGRLLAMRKPAQAPESFQLMDLTASAALLAEFSLPSAPLLLNTGGETAVLSQETLLRFQDGEWHPIDLATPLRGWPGTNVLAGDGTIAYIGYNFGEWGGGLQGIEVATGRVFEVKGLARDLDPVTGIARDPSRPDCVIASVGLMHMIARGKILRVCGEEATVIFEEAVPPPTDPAVIALPHKWPFFDAVADDNYWSAVSFGILVSGNERVTIKAEIPDLAPWHGLDLAVVGTKLIVLSTEINRRHSLSGSTPLLVPVKD